jgi:hypothetical protein
MGLPFFSQLILRTVSVWAYLLKNHPIQKLSRQKFQVGIKISCPTILLREFSWQNHLSRNGAIFSTNDFLGGIDGFEYRLCDGS